MRKEKVLVLMGGKSTEREISLKSGRAVAAALAERFEQVKALDICAENLCEITEFQPDVAFVALHGKGGEDGAVQGLLEWMNIPYTGPGIAASAVCLDKILTKKILSLSQVPTPPFMEIAPSAVATAEETISQAVQTLGLPLVLKACRQGSSIGVIILRDEKDGKAALEELFSYGDHVLAEAYLSGMELTVPVMGNENPRTLPAIEITSEGQFYDFESKYTPGQSHHIIPARITEEQEQALAEIAKSAYLATGCRGLARVDFMMNHKGEPFVIEINTSPGMTDISLFPDAARAVGISFPALCEQLCDLALEQ